MKLEKEVYVGSYTVKRVSTGNGILIPFHLIPCEQLTEKEFDIFKKISGAKKIKLTLEVEEPIIDDVERKYLSNIIRPFKDKVIFIEKTGKDYYNKEYICIVLKKESPIYLPYFKKNEMYKGMVLGKAYTLEDLNL